MPDTFGQSLRALRRSKGLTQRELASEVGVDFSYISKVENDRLPPPSADTIVRMCEALDTAPDELLALSGKVPSDVRHTLGGSRGALRFVREAQAMRLSEEEWQELTSRLRGLRAG